jgi:signal peptidase I
MSVQTDAKRKEGGFAETVRVVFHALIIALVIRTFLFQPFNIPSGSMIPTLLVGDHIWVAKTARTPGRGDVIVFRHPKEPDKDFIKRVIAVGGQTVQCCDSRNRVLVDGKALDEPYIYFLPEAGTARQDAFGPITVPAGTLWMMGDSRNNSADSRVPGHGPVPISNVIGRARFIVLPFARIGTIPSPDPQTTAAALAGGDTGAPVALGMIGLLPLAVLRRREREQADFLPRRRT